jgi:uncharacterized protein (TIRG00374 family)
MLKKKDFLILALKFIFSFSIIAYLLIKVVPLQEILNSLRNIDLFWLVLSFSLHSLGLLISAIRWQILIHAQGDSIPLGFLAKSYLVGTFFNNFLPTRFGGDIVRIWDSSRYSRSLLKSSAIVLVERFTGIVVLLVFALAASLCRLDFAHGAPVIWVSLLIGFLGLLLAISFFTPAAEKLLSLIPERGFLQKFRKKVIEFRNVILIYRERKHAFLKALFWAFLLQVNVIIHYYLAGKALHLDIPLLDYFVFIPIILIILTIPVTIGGWGLREGIYVEIFRFYSISTAVAFSFPLVADVAFGLIIGIIGGIIYIVRK